MLRVRKTSCIASASFIARKASVARVVPWSGKVFTPLHDPAIERTHHLHHEATTSRANSRSRALLLYFCIAWHAPCNFLVRTVCRADARVFPTLIPAWSGERVAAEAS